MTETTNYKLKKPDNTDSIDINVLNENADIIDEEIKKLNNAVEDPFFKVNLRDFFTVELPDTDEIAYDVTAYISQDDLYKLFWGEESLPVILFVGTADVYAMAISLSSLYTTPVSYVGIAKNPNSNALVTFSLVISVADDGTYAAELRVTPSAASTAQEQPVHMDLSGYEAGAIRLTYADGGVMDVAVTFDEFGNPIKFSNGVEEFTVTWPAEETETEEPTTGETTEEGTS